MNHRRPVEVETLFRQSDTPGRLEKDGAAFRLAELEEERRVVVAQGDDDVVVLGQDDRCHLAGVRLHRVHQPKPKQQTSFKKKSKK